MMNPTALTEIPRLKRIVSSRAVDLLYPSCCAVCTVGLKDGRALCEDCGEDLPRVVAPFCEKCGETFQGEIDETFECPELQQIEIRLRVRPPAMLRDERHSRSDRTV